ncbi:MAG: replication-associated recombination protein A, partial [candidate division SR1 bacterium]|nr:replication-associated recombination protein A [candidate division SR1 bacterium]
LAEVAIYLALSPKSNSAYKAINTAFDLVSKQDIQEVPFHLTKLGADQYKYPHNFKNHYTDQQYLQKPLELYIPCENKFETTAQERLKSIKK